MTATVAIPLKFSNFNKRTVKMAGFRVEQYIETLFNYTAALVELEKNAGIWDIQL